MDFKAYEVVFEKNTKNLTTQEKRKPFSLLCAAAVVAGRRQSFPAWTEKKERGKARRAEPETLVYPAHPCALVRETSARWHWTPLPRKKGAHLRFLTCRLALGKGTYARKGVSP